MDWLAFLVMLFVAIVVPSEVQQKVLTLREAADFLRISERTCWAMARANKLPCFRIGRQWRFLALALEAWAASEEKD